jgi:aspartyl-tRNA(Asn)/glutamyl-tRNA(Gln) amidotransferase subunit C
MEYDNMALQASEVEKIAHLARLSLSTKEVAHHTQTLSDILRLVEQIQQVDTRQVEPMAHPHEVTQRLREDQVTEINQRKTFISLAPAAEAGLYLVPKVVE